MAITSRTTRAAVLSSALFVLMTAVACGGADPTPTPTPTATPTATATPIAAVEDVAPTAPLSATATPTLTPTPTPTAPSPAPTQAPTQAMASTEVEMRDLSFHFDSSKFAVQSSLVVTARNTGTQAHELVLLRVPDDVEALMSVLQDGVPNDVPGRLTVIGRTGPVEPGATAELRMEAPLPQGRYAMVSLLPDIDDRRQVLQAFKGMVAEFRVS